ncbi:RHS repeat-associated core domain-containing protein [Flagellimonas maritima]|nr:RHS repeat-associated core domain-containing protein [Allomuricauda aurantiaca]
MYNTIGQLVRNTSEDIAYIYNASGLVTEVQKEGEPLVKFFYNDRNHRVRKENYENNILKGSTYYVRDVAGQTMAVYSDAGGNLVLAEQPIYGAGRVGVAYNGANNAKNYIYELTDHLGNVRAVFMKNGNDASLEGYTDYYPGGMAMPSKQIQDANAYRYGYQGQYAEKDEETGLNAFELRMYDPRIMRWLSPDPYGQYKSPYIGMGNDPVNRVDPDGGMDCPNPPCQNGNSITEGFTLAEVTVTAPNISNGMQNNFALQSQMNNSFFNMNDINRGLMGAKAINATYGTILNDYLKESLRAKSLTEVATKELRAVQTGTRALGRTLNAVSFVSNTAQLVNGDIGVGRYSYRTVGIGSSIYVTSIYGGLPGLTVGLIYAAGEYTYDGIMYDRAYNVEAKASDVHMDIHGNVEQNTQSLSSENLEYYLSGGQINSNNFNYF